MSRPDLGPLRVMSVMIDQQEVGWRLTWSNGDIEHHETAFDALDATKQLGAVLAQANISNAMVITWTVRKAWAKAIVEALGEKA